MHFGVSGVLGRSSPTVAQVMLPGHTGAHHCYRPYRVECTGSLLTSEVKRHRAWLVLGWGTACEHLKVLAAFLLAALCAPMPDAPYLGSIPPPAPWQWLCPPWSLVPFPGFLCLSPWVFCGLTLPCSKPVLGSLAMAPLGYSTVPCGPW